MKPVPSVSARLSCETFGNEFFRPRRPVVLRGRFRSLPAVSTWFANDCSYLMRHADIPVPVEIRNHAETTYANVKDVFERVEMPLGMFLQAFIQRRATSYLGYMAQATVLDQAPALWADVGGKQSGAPEIIGAGRGEVYLVNAWMGRQSLTPLHTDPHHNLFVQLHGRKRVRIYPRDVPPHLLYLSRDPTQLNTSLIPDVWDVSECESRFPRFCEADEFGMECELLPGDGLYIPLRSWHTMKGDADVSASVNWWFR